MCVILIAEKARLSKSLILNAVAANGDGNGLAWIERGHVRYRKGLSVADVVDLASELPLPYVFHARIATVGGPKPGLCHPFPIDVHLHANKLSGKTKKGVLFHNGHWHGWAEYLKPDEDGHWSDTRAMAELYTQYGDELITDYVGNSQRVVVFTPTRLEHFGRGWMTVKKGILASNSSCIRSGGIPPFVANGLTGPRTPEPRLVFSNQSSWTTSKR